jgi:hypothetical protein
MPAVTTVAHAIHAVALVAAAHALHVVMIVLSLNITIKSLTLTVALKS